MKKLKSEKSYATFGLQRSFRQVFHALACRKLADRNMAILLGGLQRHERLMTQRLGKPMQHLEILEVGPGQGKERARYFGIRNNVVAMDLEVSPCGVNLVDYFRVIKKNGLARFAKTLGREILIGRTNRSAWARTVGSDQMREPYIMHGNVCTVTPGTEAFDVVMSWSMMEHLIDPASALQHMVHALRPNGVLFVSLHLYTSNSGHHDIRAFTGQEDALPLWSHLRLSTKHLVTPSAYLNEWRLSQWRALFSEITPGYEEVLEAHDNRRRYSARMTNDLRRELAEYTDEELFTVDVIYLWKKPLKNELTIKSQKGFFDFL